MQQGETSNVATRKHLEQLESNALPLQRPEERQLLPLWSAGHRQPAAVCGFGSLCMSVLTSSQYIGEAEVLVEFCFSRAEKAQPDPDRGNPGPGCDASVEVTGICINGEFVDSRYFAAETISRLSQSILEEVLESE